MLHNAISNFQGISLSEISRVQLMNRTDRKFWFNFSQLHHILDLVKDDYYVLEIDGKRNLPYSTSYFDTLQDEMYSNHHRGKKNRYKIRRRTYLTTDSSFLEVKFKNNKGRTIKNRICSNNLTTYFNLEEQNFIKEYSPYCYNELQKVLTNSFERVMLVSKNFDERCTIDTNLNFSNNDQSISLDKIAIIEVKSNGREKSKIIDALSSLRIKPNGFSKYCMGRSLIQSELKTNRFKKKHRELDKNCNLWA